MTADDLWNNYIKKHPAFADKTRKVTVSVETLEKMVKSAFSSGMESVDTSGGKKSAYDELFGTMFGGGYGKK